MKIKLNRGNRANVPTTLQHGEIALASDTHELAIGDPDNNRQWVKVDSANIIGKAAANGVASLDGNGKIPVSQIPAGIAGGMDYKGAWSAATAYPSSPSSGYLYRVSVAGNATGTQYEVGDFIIFNGSSWDAFDGSDLVVSVNGLTGEVTLTTDNISEGSTNLYFTNGRADARADVRIAAVRNAASGIAGLDASSKILASALPDIDLGTF